MNRLLTTTAIGLMLGLAPALAETQVPSNDNAPALEQPATPSEAMAPAAATEPPAQTSEAPKSLSPQALPPEQSAASSPAASPFLVKQDSSELLVGNLIGETVVNENNQSIGEVTDLITDKDGKITALLIGAGGFLGIGEKDVAIRYEDVKVSRDENNDLTIMAKVDKQMLTSAPDYETLDEQQIIMGEKSDREDTAQ